MTSLEWRNHIRPVEFVLVISGLAFLGAGVTIANIDRMVDTSSPEELEALPPQEVLTRALSASTKEGPLSEEEKAAISRMAIQVSARKNTMHKEYARMREFHIILRLRAASLLFGGAFISTGSFLIWTGILWGIPRTRRWVEKLRAGLWKQAAELDQRETELARKEESLNRRELKLEEERTKIATEVEQRLRVKLRTEIEPRDERLKAQELALTLRERELSEKVAEAKAFLESGAQARQDTETAQTLLQEADTASGEVSAKLAALERKEAKIAKMTGELKALIEAHKQLPK